MLLRLSLFALLPSLFLGCLRAQDTPEAPSVSVQFRIFAWGANVSPLSYGQGQAVEETDDGSLSPIQTYAGPPKLVFTQPIHEGSPQKPAVSATVLIPVGAKKVTLLATPNGHNRYKLYPIVGDNASPPAGQRRLINLTATHLLVTCDSREIDLAPGASRQIASAGKAVVIQVSSVNNGRQMALFNNVIQAGSPGGSDILFLSGAQNPAVGMFVLPPWSAN